MHSVDSYWGEKVYEIPNTCPIHCYNTQHHMFWSLFAFREHSARELASIGNDDKQSDLAIVSLGPALKTALAKNYSS